MAELPTAPDDLSGLYLAALGLCRGNQGMEARAIRCFHELIHNWTASARHYHTLVVHLQPLVRRIVAEGKRDSWDQRVLLLAAFYHDARMDFSKPDSVNVSDSAAFWQDHHRFILDENPDLKNTSDLLRNDVSRLILATDYSRPLDAAYAALRNHDLATLAGSWEDYTRNGELLQREQKQGTLCWTHHLEQTRLFGQLGWLTGMLRSERIFFLDDDGETELRARANLGRDLANTVAALQPLRSDHV